MSAAYIAEEEIDRGLVPSKEGDDLICESLDIAQVDSLVIAICDRDFCVSPSAHPLLVLGGWVIKR